MGWVEEEVKGAIPDDATFNDVLVQDFEPTPNMQNVEQSALGSPYKHKIVKTGERYRVSVNFIPFDADILMYAINRTGTKTVDQSLTWGISQMMAPAVGTALVEQYQFAKGATCNSITINGSNESVTCDSEWFCTDVTTPSETAGITGTVTWDPLVIGRLDRTIWRRYNPSHGEPWHRTSEHILSLLITQFMKTNSWEMHKYLSQTQQRTQYQVLSI